MKAKRVWSAVLCAGLALSMCVNAGAAAQNDELRAAASYVSEQGVMVGDQNGDMALDQTLSRTDHSESGTSGSGAGALHQKVRIPRRSRVGQIVCRIPILQWPDGGI